jgi:transcription antitermination factor NusG
VPTPKKPERQFKVGDRVTVSLSSGRVVEATVKAVIYYKDEPRLQVDYGKDETALVYLWQVRPLGR